MVFSSDLSKLLLAGKKSLTIRTRGHDEPKCRWREHHAYTIQVGRKSLDKRVTILKADERLLGDLSLVEWRKAGCKTRVEGRERWELEHKGWIWTDESPVWLISLELGDSTDEPRLLAARCGGPNGDYVSSPVRALSQAGEEVSAHVQASYARNAVEVQQMASQGTLSTALAGLHASIREVRAACPDPRGQGQLRGLERMAASLERRIAA